MKGSYHLIEEQRTEQQKPNGEGRTLHGAGTEENTSFWFVCNQNVEDVCKNATLIQTIVCYKGQDVMALQENWSFTVRLVAKDDKKRMSEEHVRTPRHLEMAHGCV